LARPHPRNQDLAGMPHPSDLGLEGNARPREGAPTQVTWAARPMSLEPGIAVRPKLLGFVIVVRFKGLKTFSILLIFFIFLKKFILTRYGT